MTRVFPQLAAARIDYAWGGNVAFTRDQLPRAGKLVSEWKVLKAPQGGTVKFTIPGSARTKAIFSAPGIYELELSGSDSQFTRTTRINVRVG